jgi:hypothetical protein
MIEEWYDYPTFEEHVRFNRNGVFQRHISNRWKTLNPSINQGRKVVTFQTTIQNRKLYCVVPTFIYEFFSEDIIFGGHEIVHLDKDPTNCSFDNLKKLEISEARDWVNRDEALNRLKKHISSDLPNFTIKQINWVHTLKSKKSFRQGVPTKQFTSNYEKSEVLLFNDETGLGDWVSYCTIVKPPRGGLKDKVDYLNKIFQDRGLEKKPGDFDENRIYQTPEGFYDVYLDFNNRLFLIEELCLRYKKYTDYQLSVPKIGDYNTRYSISPLEVIYALTGQEFRQTDVHVVWDEDTKLDRLKELASSNGVMPNYAQLRGVDSRLFSHYARIGGKSEYIKNCEDLGLIIPIIFFDDEGKDFDSDDEFRIFCILKYNNINFDRQIPYPDDTDRTLDFLIKLSDENIHFEFTGEINETAVDRLKDKIVDAPKFGWNLKVMKYVSGESSTKFVIRLSEVLGVHLQEPNWEHYYDKYGYGVDRLKIEIKKFLLSHYPQISKQNDLLNINWHLMRWAQRIWGEFTNVLFQNDIEIKHRFRVTPKFLQDNLHEVIKKIIDVSGYLPCYWDSQTDKSLSLQTQQFVKGLNTVYGKEFNEYGGFIYEQYSHHFKSIKKKPSKDYTKDELINELRGYKNRSAVQREKSGLYSYASRIGLIDTLYPILS